MNDDERKCPDCAEAIKTEAKVCKHCGYRLNGGPDQADEATAGTNLEFVQLHRSSGLQAWHLVGGAALVALSIGAVLAIPSTLNPAQSPAATNVESAGTAYMKRDLKDPSSAQFEELFSTDRCVTGRMNAKNGFGAYIGFADFYYDAAKGVGRLQPERPSIVDSDLETYRQGTKAVDAFNHDRAVCMKGEEQTAKDEAAVAKRLADIKAKKRD